MTLQSEWSYHYDQLPEGLTCDPLTIIKKVSTLCVQFAINPGNKLTSPNLNPWGTFYYSYCTTK